MPWNHWTIVGLAIWIIISPWILGFSSLNLAVWNNILFGGFIVVMALWNFVPPEE